MLAIGGVPSGALVTADRLTAPGPEESPFLDQVGRQRHLEEVALYRGRRIDAR
jgi:hypothetical protein